MNPDREPALGRPKRRTARIVAIGVGLAVAAYVGLYFFANAQPRNVEAERCAAMGRRERKGERND